MKVRRGGIGACGRGERTGGSLVAKYVSAVVTCPDDGTVTTYSRRYVLPASSAHGETTALHVSAAHGIAASMAADGAATSEVDSRSTDAGVSVPSPLWNARNVELYSSALFSNETAPKSRMAAEGSDVIVAR